MSSNWYRALDPCEQLLIVISSLTGVVLLGFSVWRIFNPAPEYRMHPVSDWKCVESHTSYYNSPRMVGKILVLQLTSTQTCDKWERK